MPARSLIAVALLGLLCTADAVGQARKVQVGYCSTLKNIDAAKAAGFDYVELGTSEIAALSDDEYEKAVGIAGPGGGDARQWRAAQIPKPRRTTTKFASLILWPRYRTRL